MAAKVRPALVLSVPVGDTDRALATLIPHTTSVRGSRFEVTVSVPFLRTGVFDAQSVVTVPHAKLLRALGRLSATQLAAVERATALWLGLSLATSPEVQQAIGAAASSTFAALHRCCRRGSIAGR
jgi:mRNA interferase MazF